MPERDPKQMRVVFVGRRNAFDLGLLHWLDEHYNFQAAFYVEEGRETWGARRQKIKSRIKRVGIFRVLNELAYRSYHKLVHGRKSTRLYHQYVPEEFRKPAPIDKPEYRCDNVHKRKWLEMIEELQPDLIFSVCTHVLFKPKLFKIPKYGLFMLHEGLTPEYRGLHTAAWPLINGEVEMTGWTLLRIDEGIDSGPILCQGRYPHPERFGMCWGILGHMALLHGLPAMKEALDHLYRNDGQYQPASQEGRVSRNYSWVPFTTYLRLRLRAFFHSRRRPG